MPNDRSERLRKFRKRVKQKQLCLICLRRMAGKNQRANLKRLRPC